MNVKNGTECLRDRERSRRTKRDITKAIGGRNRTNDRIAKWDHAAVPCPLSKDRVERKGKIMRSWPAGVETTSSQGHHHITSTPCFHCRYQAAAADTTFRSSLSTSIYEIVFCRWTQIIFINNTPYLREEPSILLHNAS